jgi:Phage integrase family
LADADGSNHLSSAYDQLCNSYRAIDDFRAKLLGFLPLVTGGGLILLTGRAAEVRQEFFGPVGIFGIVVTTGLLAYEIFAIKKCDALIKGGKALESELCLPNAQFTSRPNNVLHVINEPFAAAFIYPAVLAAWTYLALYFNQSLPREIISPIVFTVGLAGILLFDLSLRKPCFLRGFLPVPGALTKTEQGRVRRAAARRGVRDRAIIAVLLYAGARLKECGRLDAEDVTLTARTGHICLHGKGDKVRAVPLPSVAREHLAAWLDERGIHDGPMWAGQRGPLTDAGITQVALAIGGDARIPRLCPRRLRHTYATRLRQGHADRAQVQALLGRASIETAAQHSRAWSTELAALIERIFE